MDKMIHWLWLVVAFVAGGTLGVLAMALCALSGGCTQSERIGKLWSALANLVNAVQNSPRLTGEHNRWLNLAMERAREVLRG